MAHPNRVSNAQKPGKSTANAASQPGRSRGRPPVISTERLLEVARQVFLELGIRATTSEVATRAGIAEGTIFHRFKSKEELFRAAMNFDPDSALRLAQGLLARAGQGELRQTLVEFAERFMEFGRAAMPMMMMSWSNPESLCVDRTSERATRYHKVIAALGQYLDAEMKGGRLRRVDSEVVARMLIGSLHHYCMIELFVGASSERFTHHEFAQHVVDVLLAAPETP